MALELHFKSNMPLQLTPTARDKEPKHTIGNDLDFAIIIASPGTSFGGDST